MPHKPDAVMFWPSGESPLQLPLRHFSLWSNTEADRHDQTMMRCCLWRMLSHLLAGFLAAQLGFLLSHYIPNFAWLARLVRAWVPVRRN